MTNINKDMVQVIKKLNPARHNARLQDGGFGVDFGIWFAALITLALNGDHIATSFSLGDSIYVQSYDDLASFVFGEFFTTDELFINESYDDASQYLVSENWVNSDTDVS